MSSQLTLRQIGFALEHQPITRFQARAVAICMVLNAIDGFDVLAVAFAAPVLSKEWSLAPEQLGVLLSSGLLGMTCGSLFLAPLADRLGRRWITLGSLVGVTLGMFLAALTQTPGQLAVARVVTGLGIGAMLPSLATVVAEYSSARRRELCVSVMSTGYPIGATVGGMAAVAIVGSSGWRGIFVLGGALSFVMIPIVMWWLPESLAFLAARRPADALERINLVLRHLGREPLDRIPEADPGRARTGVLDLVKGRLGATSAALWTAFFCVMLSFYFVLSWTPQLLVAAGLDPKEGISGGVLLNLGGVVGALALGLLAARVGSFRVVSATMAAGALAIIAFALWADGRDLAMVLALVVGYCIFGAMVGLYALMPAVYPTEVRNTGAGLAIGVGRCGAIVSPLLAGMLLERGWAPASAYLAFAAPLLVAALATVVLGRLHTVRAS